MMVSLLLRFTAFLAVLSMANGFSVQHTSSYHEVARAGVAPLAAPQTAFARTPAARKGSRGPLGVLSMSDAVSDMNAPAKSSTMTTTTSTESPTQLNAEASSAAESSLPSTLQQSLGERLAQQLRQVDVNEVINTSLVVIISMAILIKLTTVDAGMTRGWSAEEMGLRMALDNWDGYLNILRDSPIATKAVTSATVYTIGDVIAQRTEGTSMGGLDRPRILRSLLAGLIGHGPLSHYWYNISEDFFDHVLMLTQWWSFIPKVLIDQSLWGPFWNNTYILLLGLMKMDSLETIWADVKRTTIPLVVSGLKLWPLAHCITYGLIPVENRLLWVDMVEIIWVTILATQAAGSGTDPHNTEVASLEEETAAEPALVAEK